MLQMFIAGPQRHGQLTVLAVVATDEVHLPCLTLEEATTSGILTIQEKTGESALLLAFNRSPRPVLVLNGEQPMGHRHGFLASQSMLLAPEDVTEVPVSPMRPLLPGDPGFPPRHGPRPVLGGSDGPFHHDGAVEAFPAPGWQGAFPLVQRQVGLMAFLGHTFLGLDALGSQDLYCSLHRRLLEGYLLAAHAHGGVPRTDAPAGEQEAAAVLALLERAERTHCRPVGLGEYSVLGGPVRGGELLHDGHLLHLSVLPATKAARAGRPH